jgi:hypothetical protein
MMRARLESDTLQVAMLDVLYVAHVLNSSCHRVMADHCSGPTLVAEGHLLDAMPYIFV